MFSQETPSRKACSPSKLWTACLITKKKIKLVCFFSGMNKTFCMQLSFLQVVLLFCTIFFLWLDLKFWPVCPFKALKPLGLSVHAAVNHKVHLLKLFQAQFDRWASYLLPTATCLRFIFLEDRTLFGSALDSSIAAGKMWTEDLWALYEEVEHMKDNEANSLQSHAEYGVHAAAKSDNNNWGGVIT